MTKLSDASITQVTTLDDSAVFYVLDLTRSVGDRDVKISKSDLETLIGGGGGGGGGSSNVITAVKTADETITNEDVPALDADLQVSLEASKSYFIVVMLYYTAGGIPDFRTQFQIPTGATGQFTRLVNDDNFGRSDVTDVVTNNGLGTSTEAYVRFEILLQTDVNSGTFGLGWSQVTSDAIATTLEKGSSIVATKLN